jgi:U3 small nucleolar RNA-associated protein 5
MFARRKAPTTLASPVVKPSAKQPTKNRIDETRTAVSTADSLHQPPASSAAEPIEISSGSSDDDDDLSDEEQPAIPAQETSKPNHEAPSSLPENDVPSSKPTQNGTAAAADTDMPDASPSDSDEPPTFGDLLRGSTVEVTVSKPQPASQALTKRGPLPPPTLSSLGTVLNQALRTDDAALLESCLGTVDLPTVRATIERLDSALAGVLLTKLAARMHRRPGRAHSLMTWVQWTLVAHGGALAGRADLLGRLAELNRVLEERSRGLGSLLALKGKLDMLDSQMQLRRESKARRKGVDDERDGEDDEEEEAVVYVEGEEELEVNGDDDGVVGNGVAGESDEEDSDEESEDDVDEPAVVEEDVDEDEVDFDDVEESGEEDESEGEVEAPPAKVARVSKKGRIG